MTERMRSDSQSAPKTTASGPSLPSYSPRLHRLFAAYLRRYTRRHFSGVRLAPDGLPPAVGEEPLVVYSNHPGWWDPLVYLLLADRFYPDRLAYGPMDAIELDRFPFFRRLGAFGVESDTLAGARDFLATSLAVLAERRSTLWITAEGRFTDPRCRPVKLAGGLAHLARRLDRGLMVPLAIEYTFWDRRLPEALLRFGEPIELGSGRADDTATWHRRLACGLEQSLDALADISMRRDPRLLVTLIGGKTGTGGIYDSWTRLRTLLTGDGRGGAVREAESDAPAEPGTAT